MVTKAEQVAVDLIDQLCLVGFPKGNSWRQLRLLLQSNFPKRKISSIQASKPSPAYDNNSLSLICEKVSSANEDLQIMIRAHVDSQVPQSIVQYRGQSRLLPQAVLLALQTQNLDLQALCGWNAFHSSFENVSNAEHLSTSQVWPYLSKNFQNQTRILAGLILAHTRSQVQSKIFSDGIREVIHFHLSCPIGPSLVDVLQDMYNGFQYGQCLGIQSHPDTSADIWLIEERFAGKTPQSGIFIQKGTKTLEQDTEKTLTIRKAS